MPAQLAVPPRRWKRPKLPTPRAAPEVRIWARRDDGADGRGRWRGEGGASISVEDVALQHYSQRGWPTGLHCENALFSTLFALLAWDALFAPVAGAITSELPTRSSAAVVAAAAAVASASAAAASSTTAVAALL